MGVEFQVRGGGGEGAERFQEGKGGRAKGFPHSVITRVVREWPRGSPAPYGRPGTECVANLSSPPPSARPSVSQRPQTRSKSSPHG